MRARVESEVRFANLRAVSFSIGEDLGELEYQFQDEPSGKVLMTGTVTQENVPNDWFMVLPVALSFGGKQQGVTTVHTIRPQNHVCDKVTNAGD